MQIRTNSLYEQFIIQLFDVNIDKNVYDKNDLIWCYIKPSSISDLKYSGHRGKHR